MVPAKPYPIEKSSWMSLARSPPGSVQWRSATCKILEEDDNCLLNIYLDVGRVHPLFFKFPLDLQLAKETILYQTVYLHMLNHTDIRYADPSLFFRKNCIGISSAGCAFLLFPYFSSVDPRIAVGNDGVPVPALNRSIFTLVIQMLATLGLFSFDPMRGQRFTANLPFLRMADYIACGGKLSSL